MAITPAAGWQVDPNNSNGVIPVGSAPAATTPTPTAAPTGTTPPPINRTIDSSSGTDPAETYLNTFQAPQTADQIAADKRTAAQSTIDALNKQYDDQVTQEQQNGQKRLTANNAVDVLSGLMGSTEAVKSNNEVTAANSKAVDAINNKRALDLSNIYSKIQSDATTEAEQQKQDALRSAEDIVNRRKDVQATAISNVTNMAKGGLVDFNSFKNNPQNADVYQHALQAAGSEDALRAIFAINRPQDQILGTPTRVGNNYVQAYKNPITGKVSMENIPLPFDLPPEYTNFQKMGDNLVAIPSNWNGDTSQLKTIAGQPSTMQQLQIQGLQLDNAKKARDLAGGGSSMVDITTSGGHQLSVPSDVAPYVNTSHSGVAYADLSTVQGTAAEKKAAVDAAQKSGIKVITNKNTALDLTNIQDAYSKLDTISSIMAGIDQPSALSRDLGGLGLTSLASMAQTNPQKAAAGALQGVGLDILKAISGVQGFRGNSAVVQQVTDHLPSIYDTNDVVQQKVNFIQQLIADREDAIVGKQSDSSPTTPTKSDPLGLGI